MATHRFARIDIPEDPNLAATYEMLTGPKQGEFFTTTALWAAPKPHVVDLNDLVAPFDEDLSLLEDYLDNIDADRALREAQEKGTISLSDLKRELDM